MSHGRREVSRVLTLDAQEAFVLLGDVRNHGRWIPLTRAVVPSGPTGPLPVGPFPVGTRFTMHSRPLLDDRMVVTALTGPSPGGGSLVLRKAGPVLLGTAGIDVVALPDDSAGSRCRVTWWEDVYLAGPLSPRLTSRALGPLLVLMLRLALHRLERELAGR